MNSFNRFLALLATIILATTAQAQAPNNTGAYYLRANGLKGEELKNALHQIIKDPNVVTYGNGLKMGYVKTDTRPDGFLRDFYSNITSYVPGSDMAAGQYEGFNYNREHTVCQSWFGSESPMMSDIIQVIPTDGYINSRRNNNPFGEVTDKEANIKTSANGYSKWGAPRKDLIYPDSISQKVTTVFEPNDEVKGDIARIYFYMATCYQDRATSFANGTGQYVFNAQGNEYQPLHGWVLEMMMRWAEQDPVDSIETARNNACFEVQGNRNPYVDYPGLEQYVWGDKQDEAFDYGGNDDEQPEEEQSVNGTIVLNNEFFGVEWTGQRPTGGVTQMKGKKGGITIVYAKGNSGQSMYCNANQIRMYKYNTLTFTCTDNDFQTILFNVVRNDNSKTFSASTGYMIGYEWTGPANEVEFTVDNGNGNIQIASVDIALAQTTGIETAKEDNGQDPIDNLIYNLWGIRVDNHSLRPGIYVRNGKKFIVK